MGFIEIANEDPLRDIFTYPGKSSKIVNSQIFLSFSNYIQNTVFNSFGDYGAEDYELNNHTWHIPFGGLLKWDKFIFGGLAGIGSDPQKFKWNTWYKFEISPSTSSSSYTSGRNYFYCVFTNYQVDEKLNIGISLIGEKYSRERDFSPSSKLIYKNSIPLNIAGGLEYEITSSDLFSCTGLYYNLKEEFNQESIGPSWKHLILRPAEFKGWAFNFDYIRIFSEDTKISSRLGIDFRKIKREDIYNGVVARTKLGDALNWKLGLGLSHRQGNLLVVSEIFYEPGRNNEQYEISTGSWDPSITGEEDFFYNWRARLGMQLKIWDLLKLHAGSEYHTQNVKRDFEYDYDFHTVVYPFISAAKFSLTTGFEITLNSFALLYNFIYSSYTSRNYPHFNYWQYLEMMEVNPIQHRLMLSYEF